MIYLGIPSHSGSLDYRILASLKYLEQDFPRMCVRTNCISLLCFNFNQLLADALNHRRSDGVSHLLLLHDDVVPLGDHWGRTLMTELQTHQLDAIAANIPLRNDMGETSTATEASPEPRRLRISELNGTITSRQMPDLLINTGMLLIDLSKPWVDEFHFQIEDRIERRADGTFVASCAPEDWQMSRWLKKRGVAFGATSKVRALHVGRRAWQNWIGEPKLA